MITRKQVLEVLQRWESAGLAPRFFSQEKLQRMVDEFVHRFYYMDEAALQYVSDKLVLSPIWPTFSVISQVAQEYKDQHSQYVYVDYYGELEKAAYGEDESFEAFVERIAEQYFPGRGEEWRQRHAFVLHFFGVMVKACKDCTGNCPHNGHQYCLRMKKGTDIVVPWASLDLCPKYKQSVDGEGRVSKVIQQKNWSEELILPESMCPDIPEPSQECEIMPETDKKYGYYGRKKKNVIATAGCSNEIVTGTAGCSDKNVTGTAGCSDKNVTATASCSDVSYPEVDMPSLFEEVEQCG